MNICIFCASSARIDPRYFEAARELGTLIAQSGHRLIFGGGKEGLMGACAKAVLEAGGMPLGISPRFFDVPGVLMTEECDLLFTETMSERKRLMEDKANAFIILPGGIGTYEEFFEVLTLKQLGRHNKPMALMNTLGYFDPIEALLQKTAEEGFMRKEVCTLYALCPDPQTALEYVCHAESDPAAARFFGNYIR